MKHKNRWLTAIGIFFIVVSIIGIISSILNNITHVLAWYCNHATLILGLAFLFRSRFWITAELSIGLIPQLIWSVDFIWKVISDKFLFGATEYMFPFPANQALSVLSWSDAILNHIFVMPAALVGLYILGKASKKSWKGAILHGLLLVLLGHLFAKSLNINCMHESCVYFMPTFIGYSIAWPIMFIAIVIIPTNLLLKKFYT